MNTGTGTGTESKKFDAKKTKDKINNGFKFVGDILDLIFHFIYKTFLTLWNVFKGFMQYTVELFLQVMSSFDSRFQVAFWLFFAIGVCIVTLVGWFTIGWLVALRLKEIGLMTVSAGIVGTVFFIVGFAFNALQVNNQIWQMSQDSAKIWASADGGKVDLSTASTDRKKFLSAKSKLMARRSQFAEFFVQFGSAVFLKNNLLVAAIYTAAGLVLPEMLLTWSANQIEMLKLKMI